MALSKEEISSWLERGKEEGATHMIVVCDTYDHEDYPVYVSEGQDPKLVAAGFDGKNMQRVMEVYDLRMDLGLQLNERRAFNY